MHGHAHACEDARQLLSSGLDGELTASETRRLARHLSGCDSCVAFGHQLEGIATTLRQEPLVPHRVAVPARTTHPRRQSVARALQGRGAAAAAILAVGLGSVTVAGLLHEQGSGVGERGGTQLTTTGPVGSDALFVRGHPAPLPIGQRNASEDFRDA